MRHALLLTTTLLTLSACFDSDESPYTDTSGVHARELETPPAGTAFGPCVLVGVEDAGWWGCSGAPGVGLACARPVASEPLSICVPQTWDPVVDDDCGNVDDLGFGLGLRVQSGAYCVPDCLSDADCAEGMACSPSSGFCAWVG